MLCSMASSSHTADRDKTLDRMGISAASFGHDSTGFTIPSSMLVQPPVKKFLGVQGQSVGDEELWSTAPEKTYAGSLRQVIGSYEADRWLGIEEAAEVVGTSVRTMQRRLTAEETTYSSVVEATRAEIAGNLLEHNDAHSPKSSPNSATRARAISPARFVVGQVYHPANFDDVVSSTPTPSEPVSPLVRRIR